MHTPRTLHALQGYRPGGCSVPRWDLHPLSRCGIEVAAPVPGDVNGQGTGHARKTMSNYPGASGSNFLCLEKLVFVPPAHVHSWMTCRSRSYNYMEMDLCLGTSEDPPLHTGRWQRERLATILPKLGSAGEGQFASLWFSGGLYLLWFGDTCLNITEEKKPVLPWLVLWWWAWAWDPDLTPTCCVTLGKLLNVSVSPCAHLEMETIVRTKLVNALKVPRKVRTCIVDITGIMTSAPLSISFHSPLFPSLFPSLEEPWHLQHPKQAHCLQLWTLPMEFSLPVMLLIHFIRTTLVLDPQGASWSSPPLPPLMPLWSPYDKIICLCLSFFS